MGVTLIKPSTIYLDTHVTAWLSQGLMGKLSRKTVNLMESAELLISPMVLIELQYLFEIGRIKMPSREIQMKIEQELNIQTCNFPFASIAKVAVDENWTRDPFDRVIVAQAKVRGFAPLVSNDEKMQKHYPMTIS